MKHLSESELLDAIEGHLPPERVGHVGDCVRCREQVTRFGAILSRAADVDVPEPSPLFWDHLSSRVRQGIQDEAHVHARGWPSLRRWPIVLAGAGAIAVLLIAISVTGPTHPSSMPESVSTKSDSGVDSRVAEAPDDIEVDEAWALVRAVADETRWDDVNDAGISARPGSAERALLALSDAERKELAALLEEELKRAGA
jgi:hypothetical protein